MADRCPYCGLPLICAIPTHIAFTTICASAQMTTMLDNLVPPKETP